MLYLYCYVSRIDYLIHENSAGTVKLKYRPSLKEVTCVTLFLK